MKDSFDAQDSPDLLEVKLPYNPVCPSVGRSDCRSVCHNFHTLYKLSKLKYSPLIQFLYTENQITFDCKRQNKQCFYGRSFPPSYMQYRAVGGCIRSCSLDKFLPPLALPPSPLPFSPLSLSLLLTHQLSSLK